MAERAMTWGEVKDAATLLRNLLRAVERIDEAADRASRAEAFVREEERKLEDLRQRSANVEVALRGKEEAAAARIAEVEQAVADVVAKHADLMRKHEDETREKVALAEGRLAALHRRHTEEIGRHREEVVQLDAKVSDLRKTIRELEQVRDALKSKAAAL